MLVNPKLVKLLNFPNRIPYLRANNSIVVAFAVAFLNIVIGALSAYPFARSQFRGKTTLLVLYLLTRMVPALALILPVYLVLRQLGGLNQLWGIFPPTIATSPWSFRVTRSTPT